MAKKNKQITGTFRDGINTRLKVVSFLFFLFGKEVNGGKWSDFGGGKENTESSFQTAIREGCEELNGFLGCRTVFDRLVRANAIMKLSQKQYSVYIFRLAYDDNLPFYFHNYIYFYKYK